MARVAARRNAARTESPSSGAVTRSLSRGTRAEPGGERVGESRRRRLASPTRRSRPAESILRSGQRPRRSQATPSARRTQRRATCTRLVPGRDVEATGVAEVEQHGRASWSRLNTRTGPSAVHEIEVGHATAQQRMPFAQVVLDAEPGHRCRELCARFVRARAVQRSCRAARRCARRYCAAHWTPSRGAARGPRSDAAPRGSCRAGFPARSFDHLSQLPAKIHRILHAEVEALPAIRRMDVRGVAGQQDSPSTIGRRLPRGVGEASDPRGVVNPVVGAVDGDERLAQLASVGSTDCPTCASRSPSLARVRPRRRSPSPSRIS